MTAIIIILILIGLPLVFAIIIYNKFIRLRNAEKDRMNFRNPPDRTPELFERFYPMPLHWMWNRNGANSLPTSWLRPPTMMTTDPDGTTAITGIQGIWPGLPQIWEHLFRGPFLLLRRHRALHREAAEGGFPAEVAGAAAAAAAAGSRKTIRSA